MKKISLLVLVLSVSALAQAEKLQVTIDLTSHKLTALTSENKPFIADVNTGSARRPTPKGCSGVSLLEFEYVSRARSSFSSLFSRPYSVWFRGNVPIHGTREQVTGQSVTGGSVQLSMSDAAYFYSLVRTVGKENAVICVK